LSVVERDRRNWKVLGMKVLNHPIALSNRMAYGWKKTGGTMKYRDGNYYHIYNGGSRKGRIFFSQENYNYLLRLLANNSQKYSTAVIAYCLMPNHYHLVLLPTEGGSVSKTLQTTFNSYVQAVNKKYKLSGSLFQGKTKSILVDSDEYAVNLVRYIHLNPVKAKLVLTPLEWKFSDYARWVNDCYPSNSLKQSDGFSQLPSFNVFSYSVL
jgi:REP element-mobilizing transposase RayT